MFCQLAPTCRPLPVTAHARLNTNARGRHGTVSFLKTGSLPADWGIAWARVLAYE